VGFAPFVDSRRTWGYGGIHGSRLLWPRGSH
jgi:hypothetical protein